MNYRLYVNGKCRNPRSFQGDIGIGGVILKDNGTEISFSKNLGIGTCCEAQVYAVLNGIYEIMKFNDASDVKVYISNLMLVDYLNGKKVDINSGTEYLLSKLKNIVNNLKVSLRFEYFEVNDYNYVRTLAEDAINL